jgi:hypothetical protein
MPGVRDHSAEIEKINRLVAEGLVGLDVLSAELKRHGQPVSVWTLIRWIERGRVEAVRSEDGHWLTSRAALARASGRSASDPVHKANGHYCGRTG